MACPPPKKKNTQKKISIQYKLLQKIVEDKTSPNLFRGNYIQYPVRNEIFPAVSVNKDVTVTSNCSHSELVSLEGTQEGKNTCHLAAIRLQPLPMVSPPYP